jgi:CRISPR type I-E-associated protein CasA/Cse1
VARDENLFDLTVMPWISVVTDGHRRELLSLRQILAEPHRNVLALAGEPPVRVAVMRLLLAILHDALQGPVDDQVWASWWAGRAWPVAPVQDYLSAHAARMRLFDPELPFMQTRSVEGMPRKSVADLVTHRPSGNNPVWLSHNTGLDGPAPLALTPAEAAGWVVAAHQFARCGLFPGPSGRGSATQAVLTNRHTTLPAGRSLTETLLLNLTCYSPSVYDVPAWRVSASAAPLAAGPPAGLVALLAWRTRLILVEPGTRVTECVHAADPSVPTDISPALLAGLDPHLSFRPDRKQPDVLHPVTCDPAQASWRVLHTLLGGLGAATAVAAARRRTAAGLLAPQGWSVTVAGVAMEAKAKPVAWHFDTFPPLALPLAQAAAAVADQHQSALRKAVGVTLKELAARGGDAAGDTVAAWWRGAARHARVLLGNLSAHTTTDTADPLLQGWAERLRLTAAETIDDLCLPYPPAVALRAQAAGHRVLHAVLAKGTPDDSSPVGADSSADGPVQP